MAAYTIVLCLGSTANRLISPETELTCPWAELTCTQVRPAFVERHMKDVAGQDTDATSGRHAVAANSVVRAAGGMAIAMTTRVGSGSTIGDAVQVVPLSFVR